MLRRRIKSICCLVALVCLLFDSGHGAERKVLLEMFTSSTCPPCAPANSYLNLWRSGYSKANRVVIVRYHVWWPSPGNDPFYLANTQDAQTRNKFYGNNYAPHMYVNGYIDGEDSYGLWAGLVENEMAKISPFEIQISGKLGSTGGTVTISVKSDGTPIPSGTLVLHTLVTESGLQYVGPNGEPHHDDVMRTMLPNSAGEQFTLALGETRNFTRSISWNPQWAMKNSQIIAFVQVAQNSSVVQSATIPVQNLVTGVAEGNGVATEFSLAQNYPNPFNPSTTINYSLPKPANVSLKIFNSLGQEISFLVNEQKEAGFYQATWNANVPSGIYFYRLQAGEYVETKKMILLR